MLSWSIDEARRTYSIAHWSEGYFDIDSAGRLVMNADPDRTDASPIALVDAVDEALGRGLRLPLLLRFPEILAHRVKRLRSAFAQATKAAGFGGGYTPVFPIKVNQQHSVVSALVEAPDGVGLEAGSKPELIAVLAMAKAGSIIICNGYKDREYIRLALIGRSLGLDVVIVIEKPAEVALVIEEAAALAIEPVVGIRLRLASIGAGKWQNTGGDKAKFGLMPTQIIAAVNALTAAGLASSVQLLHFHMGSQLSNIRDIATGLREAVRYFVELSKLGCPIRIFDVGGGLGIDYEGTRSRSFCSINYGLEQYAATVVTPLAEACEAHGIAAPRIVTESGRAMTAHHAVLVASVSEVECAPDGRDAPTELAEESAAMRHLRALLVDVGSRPPLEALLEAQHHLAEGQSLFALGGMPLAERAALDQLFEAIIRHVRPRLTPADRSHRQPLDELEARLVDKYFVNFSIFQSMPDIWAIDQVFPIVPIDRLDERPSRHGVIADLTCDSDGRIDQYVDSEGVDHALPLHALIDGDPYRLGIFLVGAYQETLGDIHNLFGDTDSVDVRSGRDGALLLDSLRRGETAARVLGHVGFDADDLRRAFAEKIGAAGFDRVAAERIHAALEAGLNAYTYLADGPAGAAGYAGQRIP